ncbi:exopolysaccharide biosynthesis protein, partial [Neisseria meningitidis]|nr:exopolysaccharide biosynthesis protein [Neisseria meningitidis]
QQQTTNTNNKHKQQNNKQQNNKQQTTKQHQIPNTKHQIYISG